MVAKHFSGNLAFSEADECTINICANALPPSGVGIQFRRSSFATRGTLINQNIKLTIGGAALNLFKCVLCGG